MRRLQRNVGDTTKRMVRKYLTNGGRQVAKWDIMDHLYLVDALDRACVSITRLGDRNNRHGYLYWWSTL